MRYRAGVVVYCASMKSILLIHRKKKDKEYWVVPGGGLESNENYEEAAKRELMEELGLSIQEMSELCTITFDDRIEKYFISYYETCDKVKIQGEELARSNSDNMYIPTWFNISNLPSILLLPDDLKNTLIKILIAKGKKECQ